MNIDNLITMVSTVGGPKAHVSIMRDNGKVELRIVGVWVGERIYVGVNAAEVASKAEIDMTPQAFDKLTAMRRDVAILEAACDHSRPADRKAIAALERARERIKEEGHHVFQGVNQSTDAIDYAAAIVDSELIAIRS